MGDAALGLLLGNVAAVVLGALILAIAGELDTASNKLPLTMVALLQLPLWAGYLAMPVYAARWKGNGLVSDFGFRMRWPDAPLGLLVGTVAQLAVVPLIYIPI